MFAWLMGFKSISPARLHQLVSFARGLSGRGRQDLRHRPSSSTKDLIESGRETSSCLLPGGERRTRRCDRPEPLRGLSGEVVLPLLEGFEPLKEE